MSNDIKINREQVQRWLDDMGPEKYETAPSLKRKREELRALLAADPVPPLIQTLHANGDSIAMEATIAQQAQRIADLERGRGEPVAVIRKVVTDTSTGYEGVVLATAIISGLVDDGTKLYTSPPAPVALTARIASLEAVLLQVADAFDGGPEHPWIPGYNAKPIFQPVMDAVKDLRSAQSGEPPQ